MEVPLLYSKDTGERGYMYNYPRTPSQIAKSPNKEQSKGEWEPVNTIIRDARQENCKLNSHSFELVSHTTSLINKDFYTNEEKIKDVYYKEIENLICKETGASKVVVMHHQVRNGKKAGNGQQAKVQAYAPAIHTDSSVRSAEETFWHVATHLEEKFMKGRFLYVNAWRSISDSSPILNDHLAVCDERSVVKPDDYVLRDFYSSEEVKFEQYGLLPRNSSQHRWYYFPGMTKNEVLLFKQFDSDTTVTARHCFHTAVHDPSAPTDPPRESIEVRAIALFPDHIPNTCPTSLSSGAQSKAHTVAIKIKASLQYISHWPRIGRMAIRMHLMRKDKKAAALGVVGMLLKDDKNYFGCRDEPQEFKDDVSAILMDEMDFQAAVEQTATRITWTGGLA